MLHSVFPRLYVQNYTIEQWRRIFWSDESTIERELGARPEGTFNQPKEQIKKMFWATFSGLGRRTGLVPLSGNPIAERTGVTR